MTDAQPDGSWSETLLGFIGGYVDTLGVIGLTGQFTAHATRIFVMIRRAVVDPTQDLLLELLNFPVLQGPRSAK